ncbi:metal ABC transporter permease [Neptuniibacter sp. QD48_11]|uniref:metal ABC transporter permease n=1 Tax=unclassified Neptuniibacter TaxID=2630693 RepID=UPI0039F62849
MQALSIGLPALVAGLLILASHVPLGRQVLKRGIVFIDLAIAQLAALGTILATQWHFHDAEHDHGALISTLMAVLFSLLGVALVAWINRNLPDWREAFIGLIYVASASLLVLVVAGQPQGGQALTRTLSGDVLWLTWADLVPLGVMAIVIQLLALFRPQSLERFFYIAFAVTITLSVMKAGIYLVFACLIAPALAAQVRGKSVGWAYLVGVIGFVVGLLLAWSFDLPAAATIVLSLILTLTLALVIQVQFQKQKVSA